MRLIFHFKNMINKDLVTLQSEKSSCVLVQLKHLLIDTSCLNTSPDPPPPLFWPFFFLKKHFYKKVKWDKN